MTDITNKQPRAIGTLEQMCAVTDRGPSILTTSVRAGHPGSASHLNRYTIFERLVITAIAPVLVLAFLFGCQSAQEKASAASTDVSHSKAPEGAKIAASEPATKPEISTTANATAASAVESKSGQASPPSIPIGARPKGGPVAVPTTAAEPTAKPAVPARVVSDGVVTAAKAAFESNRCGICHIVGTFPNSTHSTAKNDLGSVGITRSSEWISEFLQKKTKLDGKSHIKTFAGTVAERESLAQWLAAQKAGSLPTRP